MRINRRAFLKGTAAVGGGLLATKLLTGDLETLEQVASAQAPAPPQAEDMVPTTCWIGKQDCGMLARRVGGRVVRLEGEPKNPRNKGTLCPKGVAQIMAVYDPHRVKTPLIRTNAKGATGQWRKATWDEALTLVAGKINTARKQSPALVLWQKGRSKTEPLYDQAFVSTIGVPKMGHGAFCSDAGYRAAEYTIGLHGVLHPDLPHTRYVLNWGWNITNAGGNKYCFITWNQQLLSAREAGTKMVTIDPRLRGAGHFGGDWLPIKPGTDLAMALALCNAIIAQGTIDRDYLIRHTNAPFLVKSDGYFLRVDNKEQVWDRKTNSPRPFDDKAADPALEGTFTIQGAAVRTGYQAFRDHVAPNTPEWAAGICGLPAAAIRRVAKDLGENARIGSTIVMDGVTLPYRPVGIMAYHMCQQELGVQAIRAMLMVTMLLGAVEAVGGQRIDSTWKVHANYEGIEKTTVKDPPYDVALKNSKYFPLNTGSPAMAAKVMQNPQKYGVSVIPEVVILHMANPVLSFGSQPDMMAAYQKLKFLVAIDPWLSETADYYADVVLPAATLEKYEGPMSGSDQITDAVALRIPVMQPLFQSRGEIDIYMDLCEKMGVLLGKGGYLDRINTSLGLKDANALPLDKKPTVREIFDRWAKKEGIAEGVAYFEQNGTKVKGPVPATKKYGFGVNPPFGGIRHRLYGEGLHRLGQEMKAKGAEEIYTRDYTALPTWRRLTMDSSPAQYDLTLTSYKMVEFKQSRATVIPLLAELAPKQRLDINPATARSRGIANGDEVVVESHNAITGETRKVKVLAHLTEAIRPDVVGMPHHYGTWTHPVARGQGPSSSELFFTGEGYVAQSTDQSFLVKVRVTRA